MNTKGLEGGATSGFAMALLLMCVVGDASLEHVSAEEPWLASGLKFMVASDSAYASKAGLEILQEGGNAIDAAVAVSFALGVTRPESTGLGGGGFFIARLADGRTIVRDFREIAPAAASPDMFMIARRKTPDGPNPSAVGHLAVAVPGSLAGLSQVRSEFGSLPLDRLIAPAVRLAREGFAVDAHYVEATEEVLNIYQEHPALKRVCSYVFDTHLRSGNLRKAGETLVQPHLARLLEAVAQNGPEFFYHGPVADEIARQMRQFGGIVTEADLKGYKVIKREPVLGTFNGYQLITMPPPSSGGVALIESLNILDSLDWTVIANQDRDLARHYQIEAMKHAFADRARWLADDDFVHVPVTWLVSTNHAKELSARIRPSACAPTTQYGSTTLPDDGGTSHFCVVDQEGNAVVATETINTSFGSLAAIPEWGLILNNEMDDFSTDFSRPNEYGLIQSPHNAIAPGKRPLSSMAPTIVMKGSTPFLLLGASGGPRIISSVLNVLLGAVGRGLPLETVMLEPRPHHQWTPDEVFFDRAPPVEWAQSLSERGHVISKRRRTGCVQAILKVPGGWMGASDPRKGGRPAGL